MPGGRDPTGSPYRISSACRVNRFLSPQFSMQNKTRIRLLILDVDGVLTDGRIVLSGRGEETKVFDAHDGAGIHLWRSSGREVAIVSGRDSAVVRRRAKELGIKHVLLGSFDKRRSFQQLVRKTGVSEGEVCFVGDDLPDLPVLASVGYPVAVRNARPEIKRAARYVTRATGGHGAVREVVEHLLRREGQWNRIVEAHSASPRRSRGKQTALGVCAVLSVALSGLAHWQSQLAGQSPSQSASGENPAREATEGQRIRGFRGHLYSGVELEGEIWGDVATFNQAGTQAQLENPRFLFYPSREADGTAKRPVHLSAAKARVEFRAESPEASPEATLAWVEGQVELRAADGLKVLAEALQVHLVEKRVFTDLPVALEQLGARLTGVGAEASMDLETLRLKRDVRLEASSTRRMLAGLAGIEPAQASSPASRDQEIVGTSPGPVMIQRLPLENTTESSVPSAPSGSPSAPAGRLERYRLEFSEGSVFSILVKATGELVQLAADRMLMEVDLERPPENASVPPSSRPPRDYGETGKTSAIQAAEPAADCAPEPAWLLRWMRAEGHVHYSSTDVEIRSDSLFLDQTRETDQLLVLTGSDKKVLVKDTSRFELRQVLGVSGENSPAPGAVMELRCVGDMVMESSYGETSQGRLSTARASKSLSPKPGSAGASPSNAQLTQRDLEGEAPAEPRTNSRERVVGIGSKSRQTVLRCLTGAQVSAQGVELKADEIVFSETAAPREGLDSRGQTTLQRILARGNASLTEKGLRAESQEMVWVWFVEP